MFTGSLQAQLTATTNGNGNQLAQILGGNGVTITNVVMNCPNGAAGTFHSTNSNLGLVDGIVLTTGSDTMVKGPNTSSGMGYDLASHGDTSLNSLAGATTHDACALEFDMNVLSDSVEFRYVFGSEEYLEWVSSNYNDAFAFYITGPGIVGQQNIALIPGTNTPVTIHNVNTTTNSQYYINNGTGNNAPYNASNTYIQYDGFTTVLTAKKKGLQPCQTYHLKLVVADAGDGVYDSGVFLEANSLTSNAVTLDTAYTSAPNESNAVEGCVQGIIRFHLQNAVTYPTIVHYHIGGTATNGVDYTTIPDSIIIPAGDTLANLIIFPIADNLVEGIENVTIQLFTSCSNSSYTSSTLFISDSLSLNIQAGVDQSICYGDHAQLSATGSSTFLWSPAGSLNNANIANPIATPTVTTTYHLTSNVGTCVAEDFVTVNIITPPFSVNAGPNISSCFSTNMQLNAVVTGSPVIGSTFTYTWTPATGLNFTDILNPVASPTSSTNYIIEVASGNCKVKDTINVALGSIVVTASATNETCFGYNNGTATINATGTPPYVYVWSNTAITQNLTGLAGGNYAVTVTDNFGCSATAITSVASTNPIYFGALAVTPIKCFGDVNGIADISATGGAGNITYLWSTGTVTTTVFNLAGNTPYTISATDANGCVIDTTIILSSPLQLNANVTATNITCNPGGSGTSITLNAGHDGTANANATGGTSPYVYLWNTGDATSAISNLVAGNYDVVITDAKSCTAAANTTLTEPQPMSVTASSMAPLCVNNANGTINAACTGGTSGYMFTVSFNGSPVQTNNNGGFTNLAAGDYIISVSDANNCTKIANLNLPQPIADELALSSTPVSCYGAEYNDGSVVVTPISVLNQPYLYSLDNGGNQQLNEFYNVTGGVHQLHIINNNGCVTDTSITVGSPVQAFVEIVPGDTTIPLGESIQLTTSFYPYATSSIVSYNWSQAEGLTCTDCANPIANAYETNEYSVTVTYNDHCKAVATAKINVTGHPPVYIPNAFTPNGDGNNDVFMVYGESIRTADLKVFNRWGELVFVSNNQFAGWDGTYKGAMQQNSVFVYEATVTYLDGKKIDKKGTITLVR